MKLYFLGAIVLGVALNSRAAPADVTVHVEALLDGTDNLVIGPTGLYWDHIAFIKPGYNGGPMNDSYNGPSYINGQPWTATWSDPGTRTPGLSSVYPMDMTGFLGFSLSTSYAHEFDNYQGNWETGTLGPQVVLNRGPISLSTYNSLPAVLMDDAAGPGYNVYSVDLQFVPEPSTISILALGIGALIRRRRAAP